MAAAKPVVAELKKKVPTTSGILYSNPDDTFCGRSHGCLVGPYGVVAICEALDKAGFEIVPKREAQPSGLGFLSFCCGCHETRYLKTVTL
jgi:hypothetical protein